MAEKIQASKVEVGQIIQEPVLNKYGQTVIPAGTAIIEKHKRILKTWNVQFVTIVSDKTQKEEKIKISDDVVNVAAKVLKKRMGWNPRNNNEVDLYELALLNTATNLMKR